jgi:GNAT superfamily N-acetyltransferase
VIELQDIGPDDWKLWRELRLAALADTPSAFGSVHADWVDAPEERWRERLTLPGCYQVIASLDGTPIGMAGGLPADEPDVAELVSMWISPAGRGKGVGDALMAAIEDWARGTGALTLELAVADGNEPARNLYLRNGFADFGAPGNLMPDGVRMEFWLRKQL